MAFSPPAAGRKPIKAHFKKVILNLFPLPREAGERKQDKIDLFSAFLSKFQMMSGCFKRKKKLEKTAINQVIFQKSLDFFLFLWYTIYNIGDLRVLSLRDNLKTMLRIVFMSCRFR